MRLKHDYIAADCCKPKQGDPITGYYSHDNIIKVHKTNCGNLARVDPKRLIILEWDDILAGEEFCPDDDYRKLDEVDFRILNHHRQLGVDYSLEAAVILHIDRQTVFDKHDKLRGLGLLRRVAPKMIRYRKGIVKGKWVKHRNHTYYDLTEKGRKYLGFYLEKGR